MKVLVLDGTRKQTESVREAFSKKKIDAKVCSTSNEFLDAVTSHKYDTLYINMEAWKRGRCVYDYFMAWKRFDNKPVVFYNADENVPIVVGHRTPGERDRVFFKPAGIDAAIGAI